MAGQRFPKSEKLKRQRLWEELFARGVSLKAYPLRATFLKTPMPGRVRAQAGFAVSKRNLRKAYQRNRTKRLMREAYRLEKEAFFNNTQGSYALVFLYLGKELPDFPTIHRCVKELLQKIQTHEEAAEDPRFGPPGGRPDLPRDHRV
ncbi:ribonuclease P protein component [Robiginitalea sp. M366]|uniref:ribonuclease P protein component n=1 Tax=Robiginitalea aestuariiviva TaxID=3036903 RepID=UPI00240E172A|nr:ribonuclease P protein component [Robiginitalea aestuariiviva]MDG1571524.1 ribonuclease P protein component [Robiginitalea aestuariiviva]